MVQAGEKRHHPLTATPWNQQFRVKRRFAHRFEVPHSCQPLLFRQYPEAEAIARRHLTKDLVSLSTESATAYFQGDFIESIIDTEYDDIDLDADSRALVRVSKFRNAKLKAISPATACRWLNYLDIWYGSHERTYYTDDAKMTGRLALSILNTWNLLNGASSSGYVSPRRLPRDSASTLPQLGRRKMVSQEFSMDTHPDLYQYVPHANKRNGGDLSMQCLQTPGTRPIIEIGQDEAIFQQNSLSAREWSGANGESTPRPKNDGDGVMVSSFISLSFGFGYNMEITNEQLERINAIRRQRPKYFDKESAIY